MPLPNTRTSVKNSFDTAAAEKKPSDPTIREKFNIYRFADYKDEVIQLLMKVCKVSVETVRIIGEMP